MKKRRSYHLIFRRGIAKTKSRFLSIFLIVFIGAAFFAGLRNTPITMQNSMNHYVKNHHFADLTLLSSLGFDTEDVNFVRNIDGVKNAVGTYRSDGQMTFEKQDYSIIAHSQNSLFHDTDLVSGRNIEKPGECLVDTRLKHLDLLNKQIEVKTNYGTKTLTVVGFSNDTRYISQLLRGSNTMTHLQNDAYIIMHEDDLKEIATIDELTTFRNEDVLYNEILIAYDIDENINIYSKEYENKTRSIKATISDLMQNRLVNIEEIIYDDFKAKIDEPEAQYLKGLEAYEKGKEEFELTTNNAKIQLLEAKLQIAENKKKVLEASSLLNGQSEQITKEIDTLNEKIETYQKEINDFDIQNQTPTTPDTPDLPKNEDEVSASLQALKDKVNQMLSEIQTSISSISQLINANLQLNQANNEIEKAELEVEKNEAILENTIIETNRQLEASKQQLDDAKVQLDQAKASLNELPKGTLYTLTVNENAGLVSFKSDFQAMDALSKIFPLMFFLVAALVSLTTMTRMVEEQRLQSGVLRALGYDKKDIYMLYIKYVILATFFASILGIIFGTQFFTRIIYFLYTTLMYNVHAPIDVTLSKMIIPLTLLISVAVTLFVTLIVIVEELNSYPAILMRPKPPKLGKRIFLEKIPSIWKKLSFNRKVTIRNMFRYKKRFFMSIIGIAGCSALIVTGFGIKNSIKQIIPLQFEKVWTYDGTMNLVENINNDQYDEIINFLTKQNNIKQASLMLSQSTTLNSSNSHENLYASLQVLNDSQTEMIHYYTPSKEVEILDGEGVILSQKASELLNIKAGETLTLTINDTEYSVIVDSICENYYNHYVYMSSLTYEKLTGSKPTYNQVIFEMNENDIDHQNSLENLMKDYEFVDHITYTSSLNDDFNQMIKSIDIVVVIIIIFAALLAFIVLYNLTNINIQERMNEIATIKVLGFYPKEVYQYVFRENTLLSLIGAVLGLVFGKILHYFVISTVEIDATMFYRGLNIMSFVYAFILTMIFSEAINYIMRRSLNKIDMIESLKSVE